MKLPKMARLWLMVMMMMVMFLVVVTAGEESRVAVGAPECQLENMELHCDYRDSTKMVRIGAALSDDQKISKVTVDSARYVRVENTACINLTLLSVTRAEVEADRELSCQEGQPCLEHCKENQNGDKTFQFTAINSALDRMPDWATQIYLDQCTITALTLKIDTETVFVKSSDIKVLNIARPLKDGCSVSLVSSSIHTLQKLHTDSGSNLKLLQTTIDVLASKGLVLKGGYVEIVGSAAITVMDDSLVLGPLADLHIQDFTGHLQIKVLENNDHEGCKNNGNFFWPFITCAITTAITFIIIIILILVKAYKKHKNRSYIGEARNYVFHKPM